MYGEWKYNYSILDLGTRWSWVASFTLQPLYSLDRRLGELQSLSGPCRIGKNLTPSGNRTPGIQLVARRYTDWAIPARTDIISFFGWAATWVQLVRRPLFGLLYQPRIIMMMNVEQLVEWELAGETEVLGGNLPPLPLCPPQIPHDQTNRLSYGTAPTQTLTK
jgi:hypothetical protein